MSQMSSTAPNGGHGTESRSYSGARPSTTGRAVLLLALAVVIGVLLLHELDNGSGQTALTSAAPAKEATQPVVTVNPTTTTVALRSPADVKVLVANGVGVAGAASKVAGRLQPIGYQLAKPGNTTTKITTSSVQYAAGYQAEAMVLATSLGLPATAVQALPVPSPVTDMQASSIVVIVGNDLSETGTAAAPTTQSGNANSATGTAANPLTNGPLSTATTLAPTPTTVTSLPQ